MFKDIILNRPDFQLLNRQIGGEFSCFIYHKHCILLNFLKVPFNAKKDTSICRNIIVETWVLIL